MGREERAKLKEKAKDVAVQGEDGMFALREDLGGEGVEEEEVDWVKLRREVGEWGRVIRSPLARKGHVEVDMCTAQGQWDALLLVLGNLDALTSPLSLFIRRNPAQDVQQEARQAGLVRHVPHPGGRRLPPLDPHHLCTRTRHHPSRPCP